MLSQQTGKPIRPSSVLLLSELLPRPGASAPSVSAVRRCPSPADSFPVASQLLLRNRFHLAIPLLMSSTFVVSSWSKQIIEHERQQKNES